MFKMMKKMLIKFVIDEIERFKSDIIGIITKRESEIKDFVKKQIEIILTVNYKNIIDHQVEQRLSKYEKELDVKSKKVLKKNLNELKEIKDIKKKIKKDDKKSK